MQIPFKVGAFILNIKTRVEYTFSREDFRGNVFGYSGESTRERNIGPREDFVLA